MKILKSGLEAFVISAIMLLSMIGVGAVMTEIETPVIIGKISMFVVFLIVFVHELKNSLKN